MRLVIKTTVWVRGMLIGGQEFEATGPRAPKTRQELFERLREQFYRAQDGYNLVVKQAGQPIGMIRADGEFADADGNEKNFLPKETPQYDLKIQFPKEYTESHLMKLLCRESKETLWTLLVEEVHTDKTVQARLKTLAAIHNESSHKEYCARLGDGA